MAVSTHHDGGGDVWVRTPEQWAAVCSSARIEILETLSSHGGCSVAELAVWLDRPADGLYHHIRRLERAGLVRGDTVRRVGRHRERVYELASEELRFDVDPATGRNTDGMLRLARAHLKRADRLLTDATESGDVRLDRPAKNTHVRGDEAWLTDAELDRVDALLGELRALFASAKRRRRGKLHAITLVMSPVVRRRGAASRPTTRQDELIKETRQ